VLGPKADQADVYEAAVEGLVEDVLNGYNATIMAYGPTGNCDSFGFLSCLQPTGLRVPDNPTNGYCE
jgi:Kinesin motor domain